MLEYTYLILSIEPGIDLTRPGSFESPAEYEPEREKVSLNSKQPRLCKLTLL